MLPNAIRRRPSVASSTVADPSTVTVRIESASTGDLSVQDVSTTSSSENDNDDDDPTNQMRLARSSSASHRTRISTVRNSKAKSVHQNRSSRLNTDASGSMQILISRPTTAVSLPSKSSIYDNEWDLDKEQVFGSTLFQRNPSCPSISPISNRSKTPSPLSHLPKFTLQQAPPIFTTTSECLGDDFRPPMRRDISRRSQSLVKAPMIISDPSSPTVPLVFLTDDILLGSIRALQNERQLCRLSVEYLIDATNMRPDELARKAMIGARLPCQCGHIHSRCTLTLEFDQSYTSNGSNSSNSSTTPETNQNQINQLSNNKIRELNRTQLGKLFSAANRFISKAQEEDKRILIYGFELTPNSPLAVIAIQYLMLVEEQMTMNEAIHKVHRLFPVLPSKNQNNQTMEKRFVDYLRQLEKKNASQIYLSHRISGDGGSSSSGNEHRLSSKDISRESSDAASNTNTSLTSWTTIPMPITNNHSTRVQHSFKTRSAWDS